MPLLANQAYPPPAAAMGARVEALRGAIASVDITTGGVVLRETFGIGANELAQRLHLTG